MHDWIYTLSEYYVNGKRLQMLDKARLLAPMSYFGTALKEMLDRKSMKANRLATLSGVGQPTISRFISGEQDWVSRDDLHAIAESISDDPKDQAELIRARLKDECHGPGSELLRIEIVGEAEARGPARTQYQFRLPADLEAHFATLREWVIKDANIRDVIEGLGNLLANGDCSTSQDKVERIADQIVQEEVEKIVSSREQAAGRGDTQGHASGDAFGGPGHQSSETARQRSGSKAATDRVRKDKRSPSKRKP